MLSVTSLLVGQLSTKCYVVSDDDSKECVIIDPGDDADYIGETIQRSRLNPTAILCTHGHFDHMLASYELSMAYSIPCYLHSNDRFLLSRMQQTAEHFLHHAIVAPPPPTLLDATEGLHISCGATSFRTLSIPGHTPGSVAYFVDSDRLCFTGDLLFSDGSKGSVQHQYSSKDLRDTSISRILSLPSDTLLYPGHGTEISVSQARVLHGV